jgi:uncharacterized repeat protein (TIGR03803 family)
MKTCIKNLFLLPALIAGLGLMLAGRATAQTFTNLHSFTIASGAGATNSEGANPHAALILSGNTLYGTAENGGSSGNGTVFKVNTNGTGFTTLHSFTTTPFPGPGINSDGAHPVGGLILSGNTLYGTAAGGGSSGHGTVFKVNTNGTGFTTLHSFTATSGSPPYANSDGAYPHAGLILSGNTLYGTAAFGGSSGSGTVFAVNTNGMGFTNLYSFTAASGSYPSSTNSDGAYPHAGLILSGNTLHGTAENGGSSGWGTVFKVKTNGTGFTTLHSFTTTTSSGPPDYANTNSDGVLPLGGLILSGNTLYGAASSGGSSSVGTLFAVNTDGTGFTTLHTFDWRLQDDGSSPYAGLILSGNTLYGTAENGGSFGEGTVFSLFIPPKLTIILSGANVILTWPTNAAGFTLQSTTNLVSAAVWTTNSPPPVVVNGQNTVINSISGTQQFFRLSQ